MEIRRLIDKEHFFDTVVEELNAEDKCIITDNRELPKLKNLYSNCIFISSNEFNDCLGQMSIYDENLNILLEIDYPEVNGRNIQDYYNDVQLCEELEKILDIVFSYENIVLFGE